MAAAVVRKLVTTCTSKANAITNTSQWTCGKSVRHLIATHLAAPVSQKTEAHAHGSAEEEDDVPGNLFQLPDRQNPGDEKEDRGRQDNRAFIQPRQDGEKRAQAHHCHGRAHDEQREDFRGSHRPKFLGRRLAAISQPGNGLSFGPEEDHPHRPEQQHHGDSQRQHVVGQREERHLSPDHAAEQADGQRGPCRSQQSDNAARSGDESRADEQAFAEPRRLVVVGIEAREWTSARGKRWPLRRYVAITKVNAAVIAKLPR